MKNPVIITQIVGLFVIVLAMFGIDVPADQQAEIIAGLSALGLVLTSVVSRWDEMRKSKNQEPEEQGP